MNLDQGKNLFSSFGEAQREANRLSRLHKQGFQTYKVGAMWAVGGVHMRKSNGVKSFEDLHLLLDGFREDADDTSVDTYISEIERASLVSDSEERGAEQNWILRDVSLSLGRDIGMSPENSKTYLVLTLQKGIDSLTIKMGGKFGVHIPLVKKQCDALKLKQRPVRWYTWNSKVKETNWQPDEWFYLIEEDRTNE